MYPVECCFVAGSGTYAWFLMVQIALLSALATPLGFPFTAQAMIASVVYICSRMHAMEAV
jgi:hypothetical protein